MIVYRCKIKILFKPPCMFTHLDTSTLMNIHLQKVMLLPMQTAGQYIKKYI